MKTLTRGTLIAAVVLAAMAVTALPALAANSATDLTSVGQMIRPGPDLGVFGINLTGSSLVTMSAVHVDFAQVGADTDFDIGDLEASPDGVALWRDSSNATSQTEDVLDAGDQKVSGSFTFSGLRATLNISPATHLPQSAEGNYTYFLTVRVSPTVSNNDDFTVTLPSDAFVTSLPLVSFTAATSHTITADPDPPVAQFLPPVTQADDISWQVSEAVWGVTPSSVAFRIHGTATDVPATVSWVAATNRIVVDPVTPLTAGQSYDAVLLPNGAGAIVDRAGNELAPDARSFRAATDVTEAAYGTIYKWRSITNSSAYGGSYAVSNIAGSQATWTFTGSSVTWYTITDPYQGNAGVYIDGIKKPSANNYSSSTTYRVARTYSGLSSGTHSITIRVWGTKGSTAGKDTRIVVDAFKAGTLYTSPSAWYTWGTVSSSAARGGSYYAAKFPWMEMTFAFRGTRIDWRTVLGAGMGKADVYIDGASQGTVDNYSGITIGNFYRSFAGLTDGVHTIRIRVASTKNASSKGYLIAVDGFVIG